MKILVYFISTLFIWTTSFSQSEELADQRKVTFEQVVLVDSMGATDLFRNAGRWITWLDEREDLEGMATDSLQNRIEGRSGFFVFTQTGIFKKISGKVTYSFRIEAKENKFRYRLTDLVFHYYKEDRNYQMAPTGKTKPIEETKAPGWQKLWNKNRQEALSRLRQHILHLETVMRDRGRAKEKIPEEKIEW